MNFVNYNNSIYIFDKHKSVISFLYSPYNILLPPPTQIKEFSGTDKILSTTKTIPECIADRYTIINTIINQIKTTKGKKIKSTLEKLMNADVDGYLKILQDDGLI